MQYELIDGLSGEDATASGRRLRDVAVLACVFAGTFLVYGLIHLVG
jgi:hypothetical protein